MDPASLPTIVKPVRQIDTGSGNRGGLQYQREVKTNEPKMIRGMIEGKHLAPFSMLPAAPDKCPECAVKHDPGMTHDNRSLCYQSHFYNEFGRWPTWDDAMSHCTEEMKEITKKTLLSKGILKPEPEVMK